MVVNRGGWNADRVVANAGALLEVRGDTESVLAAASRIGENGFTSFDALRVVTSGGAPIVSSDSAYDGFTMERRGVQPNPRGIADTGKGPVGPRSHGPRRHSGAVEFEGATLTPL